MNWKEDYIRMWQLYFDKTMTISEVDNVFNGKPWETFIYLQSYKFGKLLEALGKLKWSTKTL